MPAIANIRSGAGVRTEILGLKELEETFQTMLSAVDPGSFSSGKRSAIIVRAKKIINDSLAESAGEIKTQTISNARRKHWPSAVINRAIFTFSDPNKGPGRRQHKASALAGVRKGGRVPKEMDIYREWIPRGAGAVTMLGRSRSRGYFAKSARAGGSKIGMGLASIFERGTRGTTAYTRKRWPVLKAFEPAVERSRTAIIAKIGAGYRQAIEEICKVRI